MMNAEVLAFVLYFVLMLAIGVLFFFKEKGAGEKEYFLGGRHMGPWVTAMSAQASDMSAWLLMGLPGSILAFGFGQIWIGIGLLRSTASLEGGRDVNVPIWKLISSAFVVTWINPQALIDGTMMLGAFRASLPEGGDLPFICGFGSASALWFLTLSMVVSLLGSRFNEKILNVINKVCGGVIIFYGAKLLWSFVQLMGWL